MQVCGNDFGPSVIKPWQISGDATECVVCLFCLQIADMLAEENLFAHRQGDRVLQMRADSQNGSVNENDNSVMLDFLRKRMSALRDSINPNAGIILIHHLKKIGAGDLKEAQFQAFAGAIESIAQRRSEDLGNTARKSIQEMIRKAKDASTDTSTNIAKV